MSGMGWSAALARRGRFFWVAAAVRPSGGGYAAVRVLLAAVFFVAAALKGHQLATGPLLGDGLLASRPVLIALVEFEWVLGLCMLFGLYPTRTWQVALACFSAFACVSFYKGLAGDASCNCFGRLEVSPWYTFALDVVAVLALFLWPPRDRAPGEEPDCGDPNALCYSSRQTPHHITKRPVIESLRFDPDAIHKRRRFFQIRAIRECLYASHSSDDRRFAGSLSLRLRSCTNPVGVTSRCR